MRHRHIVLVFGLLGGWLPAVVLHAQQSKVLNVALAGTMERVISRQIGPAFTVATGYTLNITHGPSIALANRIVSGELKPDVYISSDANVMELIMGPAKQQSVPLVCADLGLENSAHAWHAKPLQQGY